ncbi:LssY C-terminal domain-containing protein [Acidiphilium sp.]|uniref:LssY C-terminal domain-containing protein n=1 Tax=Acidiphilium sp. TaxID=527 RepID=UPI003D013EBD
MIGVVLGLGVVALATLVWFAPRALRAVLGWLSQLRGPVLAWAGARESRLRRPVRFLFDSAWAELPGLAVLGGILVASLWLLFGVMQDLIAGDPLVAADRAVLHLLLSLRVGWAAQAAVWFSAAGSGIVVVALVGGVVLWLDRRRAWRAMAYVIAALIGAMLFSAVLDLALRRPAPFERDGGISLLPFPGSHLAVLVALLVFMAVVIGRHGGFVLRAGIALITLVFLLGMTVSRLYLGADYLSTALEAVAFGAAWASVLSLAYLTHPIETVRPAGMSAVVALAIIGVGGVDAMISARAALRYYAVSRDSRTMARAVWWHGGWMAQTPRPLALLGTFDQPFALQFLGSPRVLRADLVAAGWRRPVAWDVRTILRLFAAPIDPATLPVLPRLADGREAVLVMIKTGGFLRPDERLVFRLWRSAVTIPTVSQGFARVWLGSVSIERERRVWSLVTVPRHAGQRDAALRCLAEAIPGHRIVRRPTDTGGVAAPVILATAPDTAEAR